MPIFKRCTRCGKRISSGSKCTCLRVREDVKDPKEKEFYSSSRWQEVREQVKSQCKGLDLYSYYILNKIEYGAVVHHIRPIKDDWGARYDIDNLIYLSNSNHQLIHEAYNKSADSKEAMMDKLYQILNKNALGMM